MILSKTDCLPFSVADVLTSTSNEHRRRSPDCMFFTLSAMVKPKAGRSKKGRASKASRMSTQSNFTTISEGTSVADTDTQHDDSVMSVVEPAKTAKSGKGGKKGAKARKLASKSKGHASKVIDESTPVASSFLEPEDDDFEVKVENTPKQGKGDKKRKSDDMSGANPISNHAVAHSQGEESHDHPRKRRATRTRGSVVQSHDAPDSPPHEEYDRNAQPTDAEDIPPPAHPHGRKKGKGGNKRGSSNVRKASTTSTASKAPLRATMPPDEEIEAALEAELDRPLTDEEDDIEPPAASKTQGRRLTRTKPGSKKVKASIAPTRTTRANTITVDDLTSQDMYPTLPETANEIQVPNSEKNEHVDLVHDAPEESPLLVHQEKEKEPERMEQENGTGKEAESEKSEKKTAAADDKMDEETPMAEPPRSGCRQASRQLPAREPRVSDISRSFEAMDVASDLNSSALGTQTGQDDSGHETDTSVVQKPRTKRGSRKAPAKKVKGGKKAALMSRNIEDITQPTVDDATAEEPGTLTKSVHDHTGNVEPVPVEVKESKKELKASRAIAKPGQTKMDTPEPEVPAREVSVAPLVDQQNTLAEAEMPHPSAQILSAHSTPRSAPSRQSSDAENQPPTSCVSRPDPSSSMQSPFKSQSIRVPLAVTTPISSPSRNNISKLQTTFPWTAVDLEQIFEMSPTADKENVPITLEEAGERVKDLLTSPEKKLTVEQWIQSNAQRGEEKLRNDCERLVGRFEDQGVRALRVLEGIVCVERL